MTFTWWLLLVIIPGIVLCFAPAIGAWLADRESRCSECGRELFGSPLEHRAADRTYCRQMIAARRQR